MAASGVQQFLEEAGCRKRAAPSGGEQPPAAKQLFLPVYLFLEHGKLEAREQLLWRLGDAKASPAAAARAFVQQYIQQPHVLERESQRLQNDLQKLVEQHRDVQHAPAAPTLVQLEVRCSLPHLEALYADDPLWDLSAPRAACEAYIAAVCNELGLDWAAHTLIMRRMKDAIDAAAQDLAAGKAQIVQTPTGPQAASPPSRMPRVVRPNEQQRAAMRKALLARQPFADGGNEAQHAADSLLPSSVASAPEGQATEVKAEGGDATEAAAAAVELAAQQAASQAAMEEEEQEVGAAELEAAADAEAAAEAEEDAEAEAAEGEAADEDDEEEEEGADDEDAADEEAADEDAADEEAADEDEDEAGAASEGEDELADLQHMWQQEGGSSEEDMPDLPMDDD
ncbi:expressed protein isoform A [Chlorella sorokiniana]|uniref:Expressed protein isoform A n=1 Tax=Chlorella sorokiniana TaxID=3076 RepID=A0A2P6TLU9_CHLSO|nr:expressed protein isoform B [Chlorella sorokiniana]PRW45264.1 expressed protein isoform A [Chlorella sorokiniana]|eukprot:PRW45263.1 expressed protein isoform B [Chlorella sorokiniana]